MAATLSDNLNIAKAPPVGVFVFRRYDRGIREGALHQYPCHIAGHPYYLTIFLFPVKAAIWWPF